MAALTASVRPGPGIRTITPNTLSASDTFTYSPNSDQFLLLHNGTGGSLTPTITGSAAPAGYNAPGGPINFNLGAALSLGAIPAGQSRLINLDSIANYLQGTLTLAAGTGIVAFLLGN